MVKILHCKGSTHPRMELGLGLGTERREGSFLRKTNQIQIPGPRRGISFEPCHELSLWSLKEGIPTHKPQFLPK